MMIRPPTNIKNLFDKNFNTYAFDCFEFCEVDHRPIIGFNLDIATVMKSENDIVEVYMFINGYNDDRPWEIVGKNSNNLYFYFNAWCDYTGFDCQGGCNILYTDSWESMYTYGVDDEIRNGLDQIADGKLPKEVTTKAYQCNPRCSHYTEEEDTSTVNVGKCVDTNTKIYTGDNSNNISQYTIVGNLGGIPIYSAAESSSSSDDEDAIEVFHGYE